MKNNEEFAKRFKWVRTEFLKLTQKDMAEQLGIDRSLLSVIETGRQKASSSFLQKMHDTFQVSPTWLLTGNGSVGDNSSQGECDELSQISEVPVDYGLGLESRLAAQAMIGMLVLNSTNNERDVSGKLGYVGLSSSQVRKKALSDAAIHDTSLFRIVEIDQLWTAFHLDGWEFEILRGYFLFGGDRSTSEWTELIRMLRWLRECINLAH